MPIDRQMDKEVVVHIYNGILLSHKKERKREGRRKEGEKRMFRSIFLEFLC